MEVSEQINQFYKFMEEHHKAEIISKKNKFLEIDFKKLSRYNPELAERLLDHPSETIKAASLAVTSFDDDIKDIQVLFYNLPESTIIPLGEIGDQLNKFLSFTGYVMKPSDIFLKCDRARYECPSCFPKGTKVLTPKGFDSIEKAKHVISLDYLGRPIPIKTHILNKGKKEIWKVNEIPCSSDHLWFTYKNGNVQVIQTKDLNIGDILLRVYDRSMRYLWEKESKQEQANLFGRLQKKKLFSFPKGWRKKKNRQSSNNKIIQKRIFNGPNRWNLWDGQQINKETADKIQCEIKNIERTMRNQQREKGLHAWKKMWRKKISQIGKEKFELEMRNLREKERQNKELICSPQGWESLQQFSREPDGALSILPYKITSLSRTNKKIEMFDLQVPLLNNFILHNGVITHNCGNIINILMIGREWKKPKRCGCGRKGSFQLIDKHLIKFQRLEIQEALEGVPDKPRRLIKKKVYLAENLTRKEINQELQPGKKVIINGFLELEPLRSKAIKFESNEFRTNIIANNIIPVDRSWDSIMLDKYQRKKMRELAKNKNLLEEFAQSLAPSFEGYGMVRKSLILQHIGGKRILDQNRNLEERETIHILLPGAPGTGKSYLVKKSLVISPLWNWTIGKGLTKAGLVACVVRDEYGSYTLEIGPLVMADGGICGIDEMEKMNPSDFGMLNNAMNDEQTKITKANIDQALKTRTCILATSNPLHKVFTDYEPIIKQLAPIPKDILDRFDVIWPMRELIDQDKLEDKYMARHIKSDAIDQIHSNIIMRNYISYAKKLIPIIPTETANYFKKKFKKLTGKTKDDSEQSHRLRGNILRWAYAHAKFRSVGIENKKGEIDVLEEDVNFAFTLMRYSFKLLGVLKGGFVKYEDMEEIPSKKEINKYYLVKDVIKKLCEKFKNKVPVDKIVELCKEELEEMDSDSVDKEISRLKKAGEIFEPTNGFIGLI